jgi:Fe-S oxidoreductase
MSLEDYRNDMLRCARCSYCKFPPLVKVKSHRFAQVCPSVWEYNFHSYSAGGRLVTGLSLLEDRIEYTGKVQEVVYTCQMCGACDVSCKAVLRLEPFESMIELRARSVQEGHSPDAHRKMVESLVRKLNTMGKPKTKRGRWAVGLSVKNIQEDKAEVLYHAGCRFSYDEELWSLARGAVTVLQKAGVDVGIMGNQETCCAGRAYELGYRQEFAEAAEHNIEKWNKAGVKTVVTSCAYGYGSMKLYYPRLGKGMKFEVYHITEYLDRLIKEGKLKLTKEVPLEVTYHDPCHLGRLGEAHIPWKGEHKKVMNQVNIHMPRKIFRKGTHGVYDPPRDVLKAIPGLKLTEMERIKEYAWCCGAGGGVKEAYPEFAIRTAQERIEEARVTAGAEAIVTACPWCERNFKDALKGNGGG